jgi:hypothetical protein
METKTMLGLESMGIGLCSILIILRIIILLRHRHQYITHLELFSAGTMILACCSCIFLLAAWCHQGIQIIRWFSDGLTETQVRVMLSQPKVLKMVFAIDIATIWALWLPKASFLASYAPAYRGFQPRLRMLFGLTIAVTVITFLASLAMFIFYCFPIERNW